MGWRVSAGLKSHALSATKPSQNQHPEGELGAVTQPDAHVSLTTPPPDPQRLAGLDPATGVGVGGVSSTETNEAQGPDKSKGRATHGFDGDRIGDVNSSGAKQVAKQDARFAAKTDGSKGKGFDAVARMNAMAKNTRTALTLARNAPEMAGSNFASKLQNAPEHERSFAYSPNKPLIHAPRTQVISLPSPPSPVKLASW